MKTYPKVGNIVDGRKVLKFVPNTGSIESTLVDYKILDGIREVPVSEFSSNPKSYFYAKDDFDRCDALAEKIKQSKEIAPLIVVVDSEGPYLLEGIHRFVALLSLGAKSFPALVVQDLENAVSVTAEGFGAYMDPLTKHAMINKPPLTEEEMAETPDTFAKKVQKKYLIRP